MIEFALWGNPPGHDSTYGKALLLTGIKSRDAAERGKATLEQAHGVTDIEIQALDGAPPVFGRASLNV